MAQWHLNEMRQALEQKGWQITALPGDGYRISGSWEVQRNSQLPPLLINFDGFDDIEILPMERSYACGLHGYSEISLYFRKRRSRHLWLKELCQFLTEIERVQNQFTPNAHRGGSKGTVTYTAPDSDATPEGFEEYL